MLEFKTDSDRHEFAGHIATGVIAAITYHETSISICTLATTSSVFATLFLSPDVDQVRGCFKCKSLNRWKRLGLLWIWHLFSHVMPYSHHRGITHWPGIGAMLMLAWVLSPAITMGAIAFYQGWLSIDMLDGIPIGIMVVAIIVPVIAQQFIHLLLDKLLIKRLRQFIRLILKSESSSH